MELKSSKLLNSAEVKSACIGSATSLLSSLWVKGKSSNAGTKALPLWQKVDPHCVHLRHVLICLAYTGEKAYLTCGPDYAYGAQGSGSIPANAILRFEVRVGCDACCLPASAGVLAMQVELIAFTNAKDEL